MNIHSNADSNKTQLRKMQNRKETSSDWKETKEEREDISTLAPPVTPKAAYANHPYGPNARPADDRYIAPRPKTSTRKRGGRRLKKEEMTEELLAKRHACQCTDDADGSEIKKRDINHDLERTRELPMLPTRPLVFRTPPLLSVLRRAGLDRILFMLMLPFPLPLFSLGVLGRPPTAGAVFSASLSSPKPNEVCVTDV